MARSKKTEKKHTSLYLCYYLYVYLYKAALFYVHSKTGQFWTCIQTSNNVYNIWDDKSLYIAFTFTGKL